MKQTTILFFVSVAAALTFTVSMPVTASADGSNCLTLNNGGTTSQQYCINPTPTPSSLQPGNQVQPPQQPNNGGQTVYPASQTKTTPNTGPEAWALPSLFLLGAAGFLLKKNAKIV